MNNKTILCIFAHPDDELLAATLIKHHALAGNTIHLISLSRGEGRGTKNNQEIVAQRAEELARSCAILGIRSHYIWDFPDGRINEVNEEQLIHTIARSIIELSASKIVTFGPDGWTEHADHTATHDRVRAAVQTLTKPIPVLGITLPSEHLNTTMPYLHSRRKTQQVYNEVVHPKQHQTISLPLDIHLKKTIIQTHASQNLDTYLTIFTQTNCTAEYYVPLYTTDTDQTIII